MSEEFQRRVYLLSPKDLSPETIAVTFAKTSRSPLSFREIAEELSDEKSAAFHEKWVVGYGHASVAEHAVLHVAFENVSRLAIECIESNRLASYTEKSTRYQRWEVGGYHTPIEVLKAKHEELYRQTCDHLFHAYHESLEPVRNVIQASLPRKEDEDDAQWDRRLRSRYVDACRFLLPAAALANVGMTANARVLEHAIRKMLSHPLAEVREIGLALKQAAQAEAPTLVKYADAVPYWIKTENELADHATTLITEPGEGSLRLIAYTPEGELRILAAALYAHAGCSFDTALDHIGKLDEKERQNLAETLLSGRGKYDAPLRALEHAIYTFDVTIDQGAYFELKRHRMMTQSPQKLTTDLGFAVPRLILEAGIEDSYRQAMEQAKSAFRTLSEWNPWIASYVVPNGFNRRVLCTLNLREVYHLCELRAQPNAHFSMRRLALRMAEMVREVHPFLASYLRLPASANWRSIEDEHFGQV